MLGQSQDRSSGLLGAKSFSGYLTDMHWYDNFLTDDDMMAFTSCKRAARPGNVVNWDTANWKMSEVSQSSKIILYVLNLG
mgnify:CR=1 FL=1